MLALQRPRQVVALDHSRSLANQSNQAVSRGSVVMQERLFIGWVERS